MKNVALLWDIDGTLLYTGGAGVPAFSSAIESIISKPVVFQRQIYSGWTDHQIACALLREHLTKEDLPQAVDKTLTDYSNKLCTLLNDTNTMQIDRVGDKLSYLALYFPKISHIIATGNVLQGAKIKLRASGLLEHFQNSQFFCSDGIGPRSNIIAKARLNLQNSFEKIIVIGDTEFDIEAAEQAGCSAILVDSDSSQSITTTSNRRVRKNWSAFELIKVIETII